MGVARRVVSVLLSLVLVGALAPAPALAWGDALEAGGVRADSCALSVQGSAQAKAGWSKTKAGKKYYRNGKAVVGLQHIKGSYYYFNDKGIMRTRDLELGAITFYIKKSGKVFGVRNGNKCYYRTLKRMTSLDAYNFTTYLMARKAVNAVTKAGDSKKAKLRKAFKWVMKRPYRAQHHDTSNPKWIARAARSQFTGKGGNCVSYAAALAYMLTYIGYDADVCSSFENCEGHTWTMIGNRVYDAQSAAVRGYAGHFGASLATDHYVGPGSRYDVPLFNPAHASRKAKVPKALLNAGQVGFKPTGGTLAYYEKGEKVCDAWRTIEGKRYYFKSNGEAAIGSELIGGTWYVFSEQGVLQDSTTAGLRIVTVSGERYRVDELGRAAAGLAADGTCFTTRGKMVCGLMVDEGVFYAADSQGVYLPEKTMQLRSASTPGTPAAKLRALLGAPKSALYSASCVFVGKDGLWDYGSFYVMTAQPEGGIETVSSVASA